MDQKSAGQAKPASTIGAMAMHPDAVRAQPCTTRNNCTRFVSPQFTNILPRYPRIGAAAHSAYRQLVCQISDMGSLHSLADMLHVLIPPASDNRGGG